MNRSRLSPRVPPQRPAPRRALCPLRPGPELGELLGDIAATAQTTCRTAPTWPSPPSSTIMLVTLHPDQPTEAITLEEAITAYTRGSAYAEMEEHRKGTLAPGKLADLAVLNQDVFTLPDPSLLPATSSVLTMVDGTVVYDTGVLQ